MLSADEVLATRQKAAANAQNDLDEVLRTQGTPDVGEKYLKDTFLYPEPSPLKADSPLRSVYVPGYEVPSPIETPFKYTFPGNYEKSARNTLNMATRDLNEAQASAEAARTNFNNASEAVNDTRAALSSEGKSHRGLNMVRGEYDRVVQNPSDKAQRMTTNDATADFFDTWRKSVDETAPKMAATWKTEGRNRMNRNGSSFTPTDDKAGTEEYKYIDAMFERVRARDAMYRNDPINNPPPSVTNEDVVNVLRQMADKNQSEYMDDLLNACKWLSSGEKESIKRSVTLNKFATNATGARLPSRNDGIIDRAIDIYQARKAPIATLMGNNIPAGNIVPKNFASNVDKLGGSTEMARRIVFGNPAIELPNVSGLMRFGPIMVITTKDSSK